VNADCRGLGTSVGRVRILAAGLALLAVAGMVLGLGFRWRPNASRLDGKVPSVTGQGRGGLIAALNPSYGAPSHKSGNTAYAKAEETSIEAKNEVKRNARSLFAGLPLMFEPNQGQGNLNPSDARAKFVARGSSYSLFLGNEGAILNLRSGNANHGAGHAAKDQSAKDHTSQSAPQIESVQMKLAGANPNASVTAENLLPGKSNYLIGNDPSKWKRGVPQFARVRYENVYPGINLVFYGNQGRLEYDFQVAPGANPDRAELEFDGSKQLELKDGVLVITSAALKSGTKNRSEIVRLEAPQIYQEIAGHRLPVEGRFVLRGAHRVGFSVGSYDRSRELIIDPVLTFSTYFGGSGNELNNYVAVDQELNIYLAGSTTSTNLPLVTGVTVYQNSLVGTQNVYIAKITPVSAGSPTLDYVTYLGGNGTDTPVGVAVDGNQDPYVAGTTTSTNFPTSSLNAYQTAIESGSTGTQHVFVTELNPSASALNYSSYLSGSGTDTATGMTIDLTGYIYVTGWTTSTNPQDYTLGNGLQWPVTQLPNTLPYQNTPKAAGGVAQFFVTKVNPASSHNLSITYSTYFGGGNYQTSSPIVSATNSPTDSGGVGGGGIAVDTSGNIYFSGTTNFLYVGQTGTSSTDFPILNAYQPCLDQPAPTTIINPPSCTYTTGGAELPDAFMAKLNPNAGSGSVQLGWSTYVGGSNSDSSTGIAVDTGAANVYIVGTTNSIDIAENQNTATTSSAYQRCLDQPTNPTTGTACTPPTTTPYPSDAFVAKFPNLTATTTTNSNLQLTYFSYLGGSANEVGLAIAVDNASGAAITGSTQSNASSAAPFVVSGGQDIDGSFFTAYQDAFIARLNTAATTENPTGSWTAVYGGSTPDTAGVTNAVNEGTGIALDVNQNYYVAGDTNTNNLRVQNPLLTDIGNNGASDAFIVELGSASSVSVSGVLTLTNGQVYVAAGNQATFTYTITNGGPDPASNIIFTDNLSLTNTLVPVSFVSATATSGECGGGTASAIVSCSIPSLQAGSTATVTVVITPTSSSSGSSNSLTFTGGAVTVTSENSITTTPYFVQGSMTDFSLSISPSSNSVVAGNTASYQITLAPLGGIYSASISLACSGIPTASSCNFTASPVTLPGNSRGSSTLNITTTIRPITTTSNSILRHFYALWFFVPGLAVFAFGSADRRRRRIAGMLLLCAIFSLLIFLPACSHSTVQPPVSGTPAGTYSINVTATSGTDAKTQSIQLTVE
jgi:uncharacterized repeat protein (TIGR01451 family)